MGGAVASQISGILSVFNSGRRRKHAAELRRVAERQAERRPLYEELLRTINDSLLVCAEMSEGFSQTAERRGSRINTAEGLSERLDPPRAVAVTAMISGSARAS